MISVKYESYWTDNRKFDQERSFDSLEAFENWMFNRMQRNYATDERAMDFPTPIKVAKFREDGPYAIRLRPDDSELIVSIFLISDERGILFSSGQFTAGKKHWAREIQDWLVHCESRRKNPAFNFVD